MTKKPKTIAQLSTLTQKPPVANGCTPCFALAFQALTDHPEVCDVLMARSDEYKALCGEYQQPSNGRSPYIDGLQQSADLLLTIVQALYDTKGDMRFGDEYLKRIDDAFASTVDTIHLMLEMAQHE